MNYLLNNGREARRNNQQATEESRFKSTFLKNTARHIHLIKESHILSDSRKVSCKPRIAFSPLDLG